MSFDEPSCAGPPVPRNEEVDDLYERLYAAEKARGEAVELIKRARYMIRRISPEHFHGAWVVDATAFLARVVQDAAEASAPPEEP